MKKETEINKAILEWIKSLGYNKTLDTMLEESGLTYNDIPSTKVLEKKWNTILTMQKKVNDLENEIKTLKEDIEFSKVNGTSYNNKKEQESNMGIPKQPEKKCIRGHRAPITCLIFHPVFNLLISSSEDASIAVWEITDDEIKQEQFVRAHTNAINSICLDSAGSVIASCSSDLLIKIWKFDNPLKCIKTFTGHEHSVSAIQFSPDNNLLYSASRDKTIKVWEVSSGFCKFTLKGHNEWVRSISLNSTGSLLASSSDDESVIVWQTDQGIERYNFTGHENKIEKVIFVNLETAKDSIYLGDYNDGVNLQKQKLSETKYSEQMETLLDITKKLGEHSKLTKKIDKEYIITCSRDKLIKLYDLFAGVYLYTFSGHDNWVRDITIHPTGKYLVSTGDDRTIRVWDLKSGRCVKKLDKAHEKFIVTIAISNRMNLLVSGGNDLNIKFFECK